MIFSKDVSQQHASEVRSKPMSILYDHYSYIPRDSYGELLQLSLFYIDEILLLDFFLSSSRASSPGKMDVKCNLHVDNAVA